MPNNAIRNKCAIYGTSQHAAEVVRIVRDQGRAVTLGFCFERLGLKHHECGAVLWYRRNARRLGLWQYYQVPLLWLAPSLDALREQVPGAHKKSKKNKKPKEEEA